MNLLTNSTDIVLKLHNADALLTMIKAKPVDASLIAVNQFKCASIFYKTDSKGLMHADYSNGRGWEPIRQRQVEHLVDVLKMGSFVLADLALLESGLRELGAKDTDNPMILLKQRVDAQFMRIDCRREVDGDCNGYWNGQYEAYETVQLMIREYI